MKRYGRFIAPFGFVLFVAYLCFYTPTGSLLKWLGYLVSSALIMICVIAPDCKLMTNKVMNLFGNYSFEIYLCHMVMFRVLEKMLLTTMIDNANLNYLVVVVLGLASATLFSIAFHKVYDSLKIIISRQTSIG